MNKSQLNDTDICLAISQGNREALSHLFNENYAYLFNYGIKIIYNDEEIIKDCIQEVFMSMWVNRGRMAHVTSVKPYLLKALRLRVYSELDKKKNRSIRDLKYHEEETSDFLNIEDLIILFEVEKERKKSLKKSLNKLSNRKKEAIYLRFFHGLNNGEIASIMDINIQSVYNLISDAISSLQEILEK